MTKVTHEVNHHARLFFWRDHPSFVAPLVDGKYLPCEFLAPSRNHEPLVDGWRPPCGTLGWGKSHSWYETERHDDITILVAKCGWPPNRPRKWHPGEICAGSKMRVLQKSPMDSFCRFRPRWAGVAKSHRVENGLKVHTKQHLRGSKLGFADPQKRP